MSKKNQDKFKKKNHAQALKKIRRKRTENSKRIEKILFSLRFVWLRVEKLRDRKN